MAAVQSKKSRSAPTVGIIQPKIFGLPIDREILFSNHKNIYKKSIEKRQRKLFLKLPFLKHFLKSGEKILVVTTGYSPVTSLQKFVVGWLFVYLKRSMYVITDQRLLHIPADARYRYRNSIAEIPYAGCRSIEMKGKALVFEYAGSGDKEKFGGIAGKEKRKIRELIKTVPVAEGNHPAKGRSFLCPRCAVQLTPDKTVCESCNLKFKRKSTATVLALLLPGGGYFYTRHLFLGVMAALLELGLAAVIGLSVADVADGIQDRYLWLIPTVLALIVEKIVAIAHAREFVAEFIPTTKNISPAPAPRKRQKVQPNPGKAALAK